MGVSLRPNPKSKPSLPNPIASLSEECQRMPTDPPFTLKQIKDAIPAHCFERSLVKFLTCVAVDLAIISLLYCAGMWLYNSSAPWYVQCVLWPAYWCTQGTFALGPWVLSHECGHYALCNNKMISDVVGFFFHSALLVPYFSWRITHAKHHYNTNRMDGDELWVPFSRSHFTDENDLEFPSAIRRFLQMIWFLLVGWPAYLLVNVRGRPYPTSMPPSHFNPKAPMFSEKDFSVVVLSDIGVLVCMGFLYYLSAYVYSFTWLFFLYGVPYLVHNAWLVVISYLNHTDVRVPHYNGDEDWAWIKGALCTVDRNYGVLNYVFHHLPETHVVHHLFPYIPHYHAVEATEALKRALGKYYTLDETPVWRALWRTHSYCRFVEDEGSTLWYKHSPAQ